MRSKFYMYLNMVCKKSLSYQYLERKSGLPGLNVLDTDTATCHDGQSNWHFSYPKQPRYPSLLLPPPPPPPPPPKKRMDSTTPARSNFYTIPFPFTLGHEKKCREKKKKCWSGSFIRKHELPLLLHLI